MTSKLQARGRSIRMFWFLSFIYACFLALMFQKLILPLFPEMHAGNGLLRNDAVVFHDLAVEYARRILEHGWGEWRLFPGAGANVGLLSALYALFGPDPAWFIPFNAAAHATGALMLYLIGPLLWPGRVGIAGGTVAAILFLVFPSSLQWYGQNHKDAFAIAGTLAMLYATLRIYSGRVSRRHVLYSSALTLAGCTLLAVMRPYFPLLVLLAFLVAWLVCALVAAIEGRLKETRWVLLGAGVLIGVGALVTTIAVKTIPPDSTPGAAVLTLNAVDGGDYGKATGWQWKESEWAPAVIDKAFRRIAGLRAHFVGYNKAVGAASGIDEDRLPDTILGVIAYAPRALVVALFEPFPSSWSERVSAPRLVGAIETSVWYLFSIGALLLALRRPSRVVLAGGAFAMTLLVILALVHPNVGTLYRQRFGLWMFVLLCGATGWASVILPRLTGESGREGAKASSSGGAYGGKGGLDTVVASGSIVVMITLLCYLGFIARDLLMVKTFGMRAQLDGFFSAAMLPMFFVTSLAMPMADVLMRPFLQISADAGMERAERLVQSLLWYGCAGLGLASLLLILLAEPISGLVLLHASPSEVTQAAAMLRFFVPILFISAWTVVGNAVLNGLHKSRMAALAQLSVPILTIGAILFAPTTYGPYPAIIGMVVGTAINGVIIAIALAGLGIRLWPARGEAGLISPLMRKGYMSLAVAAFFGAIATPVNYMFASVAGEGSVSAWALASKMVMLFNGLAAVGVASVVLPHLARLIQHGKENVRNDIYFLLVSGSWIGGLLAVAVFIFSKPLAGAMFSGGNVTDEHIRNLIEVMRLGSLQLPMVVVAAIVVKMAAVAGTSSRVLGSALLGFVVNLAVNFLLIDRFGVVGIAVGALASCALSTAYLAVVTRRDCGFNLTEVYVLIVGWIVWAGVCLAAASESSAAILCAVMGLGCLAWVQRRIWQDELVAV